MVAPARARGVDEVPIVPVPAGGEAIGVSARTVHSALVQLMAVVGVPLGKKRWEVAACAAGLRDEEGRTLAYV